MAINYNIASNQPTQGQAYAEQVAMQPDIENEFLKGQQRLQAQQDRERQMKYDELNFAQKELDYKTDKDTFDQKIAERSDLDSQIQGLAAASDSYNQDVCAQAALTTGESSSSCTDGLPNGWQSWSDERKKKFLASIQGFRGQIDEGKQIAQNFVNSDYLAENGLDPNDPDNLQKIAVAKNFESARKGRCRDVSGTQVCDIIVSVDGKDVTIKDGDVEAYFSGGRKTPTVSNIDGLVNFSSLRGASGNEFVNEGALETKKDAFMQLFAGDNPQLSLSSFSSRYGDQDGDGDFDTDDAWIVYSSAKLAELKESGNYGVPTSFQTNQYKRQEAQYKAAAAKDAYENPPVDTPSSTADEKNAKRRAKKNKKILDDFFGGIKGDGGGTGLNGTILKHGTIASIDFSPKVEGGLFSDDEEAQYTITFEGDKSPKTFATKEEMKKWLENQMGITGVDLGDDSEGDNSNNNESGGNEEDPLGLNN